MCAGHLHPREVEAPDPEFSSVYPPPPPPRRLVEVFLDFASQDDPRCTRLFRDETAGTCGLTLTVISNACVWKCQLELLFSINFNIRGKVLFPRFFSLVLIPRFYPLSHKYFFVRNY